MRANLVTQFNQLKDQLDKTAAELQLQRHQPPPGRRLKLFFNEFGTSTLTIQSTNPRGQQHHARHLDRDQRRVPGQRGGRCRLQSLSVALGNVASQASDFGSHLSVVQNRQTFTNNMINTLRVGADGLTLADTNEEGANMLALQTRQQLSVTALSLASQAQQSVLKLFG